MLVFHPDEVKATSGRSGASGRAVASLQDPRDIFWLQTLLPNKQKSSDEVANHVVQKSAASNGIDKLVSAAAPL